MKSSLRKLLTFRTNKQTALRIIEPSVLILVVVIFFMKVTGYAHFTIDPASWISSTGEFYKSTAYNISTLKYFASCPEGQLKISVGQQYLCRANTQLSVYQNIYDTVSRTPNGSELIYSSKNQWSQKTVGGLMKNQYVVDGFKTLALNSLPSWNEDPYNNATWRADFYSLSDLNDLLNAPVKSHSKTYAEKIVNIIDSFDTVGVNAPMAWETPHVVALRSITMQNIWSKLHALNMLPITTSTHMLEVMQRQAEYLSQDSHYDTQYAQGIDEAASLYTLGVNMPKLPGAKSWVTIGASRLNNSIDTAVNSDGALIGHSPNEDFNTLAKYWDIYSYSKKYGHPLSDAFAAKVMKMINYATYLLQPNSQTPILGSSVNISIQNEDEFAAIANFSPQFKYAVTRGRDGTTPESTNIQFKTTGQTIFRTGWQSSDYTQQTQTIFNYGSTAGSSSQLNSLGLNLYAGGSALIVSPGAATNDMSKSVKDYVRSTSSQNTVQVDGHDQSQGGALSSDLVVNKDYSSQSASNTLNLHITHERQVIQISSGVILVLDKLHSDDKKQHTFEQKFNFAPGMSYQQDGTKVIAQGSVPQQRIQINQLTSNITTTHLYNQTSLTRTGGICIKDRQVVACNQVDYMQKGTDATYVTLLQVGKPHLDLTYSMNGSSITIEDKHKTYTVSVGEKSGQSITAKASDVKTHAAPESVIDGFNDPLKWRTSGGSLTLLSDSSYQTGQPALQLSGSKAIISRPVQLNLSHSNLLLRMKMIDTKNVRNVSIDLHSNNGVAHLDLRNAYHVLSSSDPVGNIGAVDSTDQQSNIGWSTMSLAKGSQRTEQGQWMIRGYGFSWASIDQIDLSLESSDGSIKQVEFGQLSATPEQPQATVGIVFDDGSASILPAVQYMNEHNIQGSVAVIGKYVDQQTKGYLSLAQLRDLKGEKWSLVNHSYDHQDALSRYFANSDLSGFRQDLLEGANFLEKNNLDTDPNWYIYPHGTTNPSIEAIVGQYYKFARTENRGPEAFPFGSPLAVKDFVVDDSTKPSDVMSAINDANEYHQTLLLTFHRIHSTPSDKSGYDFDQFKSIIDYLSATHSNVLSLNGIDHVNGVSTNKLQTSTTTGDQLTSTVVTQQQSFIQIIAKFFKSLFLGYLSTDAAAEPIDKVAETKYTQVNSNYHAPLLKNELVGHDRILTNEFQHWNPGIGCPYVSDTWDMTSGTLLIKDNTGYSGIPTAQPSSVCQSQDKSNSTVFSLTTKKMNFSNIKVSLDYKIVSHTSGVLDKNSYDGLSILIGYQSEHATYAASIFRWDAESIIKKKVPATDLHCHQESGTDCYYNLGGAKQVAALDGKNIWHHADVYFISSGGVVEIKEDIDGGNILDVIDRGVTVTSYQTGAVGIQGSNTEFYFKSFMVYGR